MSNVHDYFAEEGGKMENKQKWQFWKLCPINYADKEGKYSVPFPLGIHNAGIRNWDGYK